MLFILSVTIAMDGSKLSLFVIFKGILDGNMKYRCLLYYRPVLFCVCSQKHGWITGR